MDSFLQRYATPLTTGLFVISTVSGIALFFHWQPGAFRGMHEWLSLVLLLPFGLHVWKNWRPLVGYLRRGTLILPLVACAVIAVPFAVSGLAGGSAGGNPAMRTLHLMATTPLEDLAPVLKSTPEALRARLAEKGYTVAPDAQTLGAIASASGTDALDLVVVLLPASRAP